MRTGIMNFSHTYVASNPEIPDPNEPKPEIIPVTSISVSPSTATLEEGKTLQLVATCLPENATEKAITWSVVPEGIATVSNGLVTAIKEGTATIKASASNGISSEVSVIVSKKVVAEDGKADLRAAIAEAKTYQAQNYTPESFSSFLGKIQAAETVLNYKDASEKAIEESIKDISDAKT